MSDIIGLQPYPFPPNRSWEIAFKGINREPTSSFSRQSLKMERPRLENDGRMNWAPITLTFRDENGDLAKIFQSQLKYQQVWASESRICRAEDYKFIVEILLQEDGLPLEKWKLEGVWLQAVLFCEKEIETIIRYDYARMLID